MNFLEAHKVVKEFKGGDALHFLLAMSGLPDKLDIFLQAAAARQGYQANFRTLPFNTLQQVILSKPVKNEKAVFLLFPWDLLLAADWRSGFSERVLSEDYAYEQVKTIVSHLIKRPDARFLYIPAPIPPLFSNVTANHNIENWLLSVVRSLGARILSPDVFSMGSYLDNGSPFSGAQLGDVAEEIISQITSINKESCKVLVTDLDNVMWHGVIGEDGIDGIHFESHGIGYRFFIYQTFLLKLKREGVMLAAVSRNDEDLALQPFREMEMLVKEDDFVSIIASYNAKSAQIAELAKQLNLGLDSFVFVDDNPIELAEVSNKLAAVNCVLFPSSDEDMPRFFSMLSQYFSRALITEEDKERTEMYRRRLKGLTPSDIDGADLSDFLRQLKMKLTIHDRTHGNRIRAVQLINKTNQFNLNGIRLSDEQVADILESGGRLFTASLSDQHGAHGEVLTCLISRSGDIHSLVMSCRVFQRRVEYAFIVWLLSTSLYSALVMDYKETERNEPFRKFLNEPVFNMTAEGKTVINVSDFFEVHSSDFELFDIIDSETNRNRIW